MAGSNWSVRRHVAVVEGSEAEGMSGEGRWQTVGKKDHHQRKGREERAPAGGGIGQSLHEFIT